MIPLFTTSDIRSLDNYAISKIKIPSIVLMENAAINITEIVYNYCSINSFRNIGIICGKGNNGGDGLAVARHLALNNFNITVITLSTLDEMSSDSKTNYLILKELSQINLNIKIHSATKSTSVCNILKDCDVIIDAILGSGASGKLKSNISSIVKGLNKLDIPKIALDIPTGLDSDKGYGNCILKCDLTITLCGYKKGLFFNYGFLNAGQIELADIGIDPVLFENITTNTFVIEPEDAFDGIPVKSKNAHKYTSGKTLSICGSGKYPGAGALAAKSALKIGAGSSILAFPKVCRNLVYKDLAEVVVAQYDDHKKEFLTSSAIEALSGKIIWADTVAIGSGLGREEETINAVRKLLKEKKYKNIIIDADAIFALKESEYKKYNLTNAVFTPHLKEFSVLIGVDIKLIEQDVLKYGIEFVKETGSYLVLKSMRTIIFTPDEKIYINSCGNPGMAKFGTGDVLTGILAGLLAQSNEIEKALIAGVYIHSLSADILKVKFSENTFSCIDLIDNFGDTIKFIRKSVD